MNTLEHNKLVVVLCGLFFIVGLLVDCRNLFMPSKEEVADIVKEAVKEVEKVKPPPIEPKVEIPKTPDKSTPVAVNDLGKTVVELPKTSSSIDLQPPKIEIPTPIAEALGDIKRTVERLAIQPAEKTQLPASAKWICRFAITLGIAAFLIGVGLSLSYSPRGGGIIAVTGLGIAATALALEAYLIYVVIVGLIIMASTLIVVLVIKGRSLKHAVEYAEEKNGNEQENTALKEKARKNTAWLIQEDIARVKAGIKRKKSLAKQQ